MLVSVILLSSPVCEKQALFAICQSVKENGLDPALIKKVSCYKFLVPIYTFIVQYIFIEKINTVYNETTVCATM